jgi:hypothetical protein
VQQLKNSSSCLVPLCDGIATAEWQAALGITQGGRRPREKQKNEFPPKASHFPIIEDHDQGEGHLVKNLCYIFCSSFSLVLFYNLYRKLLICFFSFYSPCFSFVSEQTKLYAGPLIPIQILLLSTIFWLIP